MIANIEIETCKRLERKEREAARLATTLVDRDLHLMRAERHADRAWSLAEATDGPYLPSSLWDRLGPARHAA